jgi:CHASE3 domain sensor protein
VSDDDAQRALRETAAVRAEVSVLREGVGRVADRVETVIFNRVEERERAAEERRAARRYTLTTVIAASSLTLVAVGLFVRAVAG